MYVWQIIVDQCYVVVNFTCHGSSSMGPRLELISFFFFNFVMNLNVFNTCYLLKKNYLSVTCHMRSCIDMGRMKSWATCATLSPDHFYVQRSVRSEWEAMPQIECEEGEMHALLLLPCCRYLCSRLWCGFIYQGGIILGPFAVKWFSGDYICQNNCQFIYYMHGIMKEIY